MPQIATDGSLLSDSGVCLFLSTDRFRADIVRGGCCFVCGVQPGTVPFNDEHVIPRWVLRRFELFERTITLPNGSTFRYGQYKVPCCEGCNTVLGESIEKPVSAITEGGLEAVAAHVKEKGPWLLFYWLVLIYFKTHLRDLRLRESLDGRLGSNEKIGDRYDWEGMHHLHCLIRSPLVEASLCPEVLGSLYILPVDAQPLPEPFDYADLYQGQAVLVRLGSVCLVAVLNDAGAASSIFAPALRRLHLPLNPLQAREILARLAFINASLEVRPEFFSEVSAEEKVAIRVRHPPKVALVPFDQGLLGGFMERACLGLIREVGIPLSPEVQDHIKNGKWSFLPAEPESDGGSGSPA